MQSPFFAKLLFFLCWNSICFPKQAAFFFMIEELVAIRGFTGNEQLGLLICTGMLFLPRLLTERGKNTNQGLKIKTKRCRV